MDLSRRTTIIGGLSAAVVGITGLLTGIPTKGNDLPDRMSTSVHHSKTIGTIFSTNDSDVISTEKGGYKVFTKLDTAAELIGDRKAERFIQKQNSDKLLLIYQEMNYPYARVEVADVTLDGNTITIFIRSSSTGEGLLAGSIHSLLILLDINGDMSYEGLNIKLEYD